jgi:hypothetical protein
MATRLTPWAPVRSSPDRGFLPWPGGWTQKGTDGPTCSSPEATLLARPRARGREEDHRTAAWKAGTSDHAGSGVERFRLVEMRRAVRRRRHCSLGRALAAEQRTTATPEAARHKAAVACPRQSVERFRSESPSEDQRDTLPWAGSCVLSCMYWLTIMHQLATICAMNARIVLSLILGLLIIGGHHQPREG